MKIALATCTKLPDYEVDDNPFVDALRSLGVDATWHPWTDGNVDWSKFDACLIRTTWDYCDDPHAFNQWANHVSTQTRLLNPASIVRWNTHKTYLRDLESRGVRIIPTVWLAEGSSVNVASAVRKENWSRAFLKPCIGATARETLRFTDSPEDLERAQAHVDRLLLNESLMLQPYMEKVETDGEYSMLFFGDAFSHGVRKIPVPGDYRVQDDFGATDEPWSPTEAERAEGLSIVQAAPEPVLYARVDLIRNQDGQLCLTELELVEPSLFFRHDAGAPERFARAVHQAVLNLMD